MQVSASNDDGYQHDLDGQTLGDSEVLVRATTAGSRLHGGLRFSGVALPRGAHILSAKLSVKVGATNDVDCAIVGSREQNAQDFAGQTILNHFFLYGTSASVAWVQDDVPTSGGWADSPDISSVLQEIVDASSWESGDHVVLILMANERGAPKDFSFASYDGGPGNAVHLVFTWGLRLRSPPAGIEWDQVPVAIAADMVTRSPVVPIGDCHVVQRRGGRAAPGSDGCRCCVQSVAGVESDHGCPSTAGRWLDEWTCRGDGRSNKCGSPMGRGGNRGTGEWRARGPCRGFAAGRLHDRVESSRRAGLDAGDRTGDCRGRGGYAHARWGRSLAVPARRSLPSLPALPRAMSRSPCLPAPPSSMAHRSPS